MLELIKTYIQLAEDLRSGKTDIDEYYWCPPKGDDTKDTSFVGRYKIFLGLKHAPPAADPEAERALLHELVTQEITMIMVAKTASRASDLAAALLSRYKNPEDVVYFLDLRYANYDAMWSGSFVDEPYVLSAGIKETFDYVAQHPEARTGGFYELVGTSPETCLISARQYKEWQEEVEYLLTPYAYTLEEMIEMAYDLEETDMLKAHIAEWRRLHPSPTDRQTWFIERYDKEL